MTRLIAPIPARVRRPAVYGLLSVMIGLGLAACGADKQHAMPDVVGMKLDIAKSEIKNAGFADDVKVDGGGVLGVWNDSNWTVCAQVPTAGAPLAGTPELTVDRSCSTGGAATSTSPDATASQSASASPSEVPKSQPPAPSSSSTVAAGPITTKNNKDFAALLADGSADCDNRSKTFSKKYYDEEIEFDGHVTNMASHNGDTYLWDILVSGPKVGIGPDFKFDGVGIFPGDHASGEMNLPANSGRLQQGDRVHLVARVGSFNPTTCLFFLTPVSTKIIN